MIKSDIIAAIQGKCEDADVTSDEILAMLNRCLLEVAGGGDRPHGYAKLAPLPNLQTTATVNLTGETVSLPDGFQRGLSLVYYGQDPLKRYDSPTELIMDYMSVAEGTPEAYYVKGNTLEVRPGTSSSTALTVFFFEKPTVLTSSVDGTPGCLPEHFHYKILVNYGCREIHALIEDGQEGGTPNTDKYNMLYQQAITDLERELGPEDIGPDFIIDDGDYI